MNTLHRGTVCKHDGRAITDERCSAGRIDRVLPMHDWARLHWFVFVRQPLRTLRQVTQKLQVALASAATVSKPYCTLQH